MKIKLKRAAISKITIYIDDVDDTICIGDITLNRLVGTTLSALDEMKGRTMYGELSHPRNHPFISHLNQYRRYLMVDSTRAAFKIENINYIVKGCSLSEAIKNGIDIYIYGDVSVYGTPKANKTLNDLLLAWYKKGTDDPYNSILGYRMITTNGVRGISGIRKVIAFDLKSN